MVLRYQRSQAVLAEFVVLGIGGFGDSVGEEHQDVALLELYCVLLKLSHGKNSEHHAAGVKGVEGFPRPCAEIYLIERFRCLWLPQIASRGGFDLRKYS